MGTLYGNKNLQINKNNSSGKPYDQLVAEKLEELSTKVTRLEHVVVNLSDQVNKITKEERSLTNDCK